MKRKIVYLVTWESRFNSTFQTELDNLAQVEGALSAIRKDGEMLLSVVPIFKG